MSKRQTTSKETQEPAPQDLSLVAAEALTQVEPSEAAADSVKGGAKSLIGNFPR